MTMIEVQTASPKKKEAFQSYDDLFDHIVEVENHKMLELEPYFPEMQWSFTTYSPHYTQALYTHLKDRHPAVKQACNQNLPLIEICTGDFAHPEYVVATENAKIRYLKKKWALAYCAAHNATVSAND